MKKIILATLLAFSASAFSAEQAVVLVASVAAKPAVKEVAKTPAKKHKRIAEKVVVKK